MTTCRRSLILTRSISLDSTFNNANYLGRTLGMKFFLPACCLAQISSMKKSAVGLRWPLSVKLRKRRSRPLKTICIVPSCIRFRFVDFSFESCSITFSILRIVTWGLQKRYTVLRPTVPSAKTGNCLPATQGEEGVRERKGGHVLRLGVGGGGGGIRRGGYERIAFF